MTFNQAANCYSHRMCSSLYDRYRISSINDSKKYIDSGFIPLFPIEKLAPVFLFYLTFARHHGVVVARVGLNV